MPDIGGWEWVILAVVALVLFGGSKLAGVGKNAGRAIREFKEEMAAPTSTETPAPAAAPTAAVVEQPPADDADQPAVEVTASASTSSN